MLAEQAGHPVHVIRGDAANVKITTAADLEAARRDVHRAGRIGTGYDLHRLVEGRPLILGGVRIPSPFGALGHSDADVVCHAATDAILGAAALGDIGRHFPDTDPAWKDASSVDLLRRAAVMAGEAGFEVVNLDVVVVLERPKIAPLLERIRAGSRRRHRRHGRSHQRQGQDQRGGRRHRPRGGDRGACGGDAARSHD